MQEQAEDDDEEGDDQGEDVNPDGQPAKEASDSSNKDKRGRENDGSVEDVDARPAKKPNFDIDRAIASSVRTQTGWVTKMEEDLKSFCDQSITKLTLSDDLKKALKNEIDIANPKLMGLCFVLGRPAPAVISVAAIRFSFSHSDGSRFPAEEALRDYIIHFKKIEQCPAEASVLAGKGGSKSLGARPPIPTYEKLKTLNEILISIDDFSTCGGKEEITKVANSLAVSKAAVNALLGALLASSSSESFFETLAVLYERSEFGGTR